MEFFGDLFTLKNEDWGQIVLVVCHSGHMFTSLQLWKERTLRCIY